MSGKIDAAYWAERFTQLEQSNHREAEKVMQDVESAYREAARELEGQISSWYRRFADNNGIVSMAEARRLLNSRELAEFKWTVGEYARHAKENGVTANWTKQLENASARWHISRLEALKVQMQNTVEVLYGNQLDSLDALAKNTFLFSYNHTAYEIQRGTGIGFDIAGLNQKAIQTAIYKPWTLDGRNFSDRIWANKEALINELHKQLSQNLMMGGNLDRIVEIIEKKMGVSKYNAGRLVYTENAYIQAVATGESYRATGVKQFLFVATLDDRTSDICRDMDGNVYDMKDYQPGVTVPPLHPWCRSCTAPHYADMAGVGERFARNPDDNTRYFVPRNMTYKQWEQSFVTNPGTGQPGSKAGLTPISATGILSLADCKTAKDVETLMKQQKWFNVKTINGKIYDTNEGISLDGCDLEIAKGIYTAIEDIYKKYPEMIGKLNSITTSSKIGPFTYAQCSYGLGHGGVTVNKTYFSNLNKLIETYKKDLASGFHPAGTDWKAIIQHEFGHAVDDYLSYTLHAAGANRTGWKPKEVSADLRPKVMKACGLKISDTYKEVSGYATKNAAEWFAECFGEMMNSATPRAVAKEFEKQVTEIIRKAVK